MSPAFFHSVFVAYIVLFAFVRVYFRFRAWKTEGQVEYREGKLNTALRAFLGGLFLLGVLFYILRPQALAWAELSLPQWSQWLGVGLGLISLPFLAWTQLALGSNFSATLHVRRKHTLVTGGPYRYLRHPMYTALFLSLGTILLLTRNWLVGGVPLVGLCVIVLLRVRHEERVMLETFGDAYREYIQRIGRFWPRRPIP